MSDVGANVDSLHCLVRLVELAYREHYNCEEDTWYGCPKSKDGCCNDAVGCACTCGADEHNAEVAHIASILLPNAENQDLTR